MLTGRKNKQKQQKWDLGARDQELGRKEEDFRGQPPITHSAME